MNKQNLQQFFNQPYSRHNWLQLFPAIFAKFEQLALPVEFPTSNKKIESLQQLGTITLADDKKIAVFEVKVADSINLTLNRVELNNTISTFIDQWNTHAAIGVFYQCSPGFQPENQCSLGFQPENQCSPGFQPENSKNRQDACATLDYRFTFAQRQTVWGKEGMQEIKTHSKRYTYVLGPNESCKTAAERFALLAEHQATTKMPDLLDAFSVEKLSKQFYTELSNWYFWAIKHVTFPSEPTKFEAEEKKVKHDELIQEHNAKNVIRLLTRLLFVWFIKQKKLIPDKLFDLDALQNEILKELTPYHEEDLFNKANRNSIYYKAILQNLFFASLNCPINKSGGDKRSRGFRLNNNYGQHRDANYMMRYEKYFNKPDTFLDLINSTVPFLNGGLFECLDDKLNNSYIDGFSDQMTKGEKLIVPDFLFFGIDEKTDLTAEYGIKNKATREASVKGLINILKAYNFTIVENTPIDEEVALDPELLGKVFENLLASYNPETKTTARKQTGSFYTPREIVDYMVDESLKASIANTVADKLDSCTVDDIKAGLDILFAYTDTDHPFNAAEADAVMNAVSELKILDPACGSGAFPMGILHKLVFILEKLDPDNSKWRDIQKAKALLATDDAYNLGDETERHQRLEEIKIAFDFNSSNYGRKLFLIENSIYGVDIQPIATQISKLRFFISLVVDQTVDYTKDNFGVRPLPNLETQFVTANTLIGIEKDKDILFENTEVKQLEAQLEDVRHRLFSSKTPSHKRDLRQQDEALRNLIAEKLIENGFINESARQLAKWNPYDQNASSPFFDMKWMFGIKDGFDIVIGNPPYISHDSIENKKYFKKNYISFEAFADIFCYFFENGLNLLSTNGVILFITSNSYLRSDYGGPLRKFIFKNAGLQKIINMPESKIFETAIVDTVITEISSSCNRQDILIVNKQLDQINFDKFIKGNSYKVPYSNFNRKVWSLLTEDILTIQSKIENHLNLEELGTKIRLGIATGQNNAFIIDGQKKQRFLTKNIKNADLIKPILRGKDISRYSYNQPDLFVLLTKNNINVKDDYPDIYDHFNSFGESFKKRGAKGKHWTNLRACAFFDDFKREKIIWIELTNKGKFALCSDEIYLLNSAYFLLPPKGINSKYLLSILNSKIIGFYIKTIAATSGMGTIRWINNYVKEFPIPEIQKCKQKPFETLVDQILELTKDGEHLHNKQKQHKFLALETEIDARVAILYNLTADEYAMILEGADDEFRIKALNFHSDLLKGLIT